MRAARLIRQPAAHGASTAGARPRAGIGWRQLKGWERGLFVFFVWITIEDQARKLLGNNMALYFLKDALFLYTALACLFGGGKFFRRRAMPSALGATLSWGLLVSALGSLNPKLTSLLIPLVGLKLTFMYVPLFHVGFRVGEEGRCIRPLLWLIVATGALTAAAGIFQALLDPTFLNPAPEDALEGFQLRMVREQDIQYVTSTFLSPGRYVLFLLNAFAAGGLLYLWEALPKLKARLLAQMATIALGLATSGARLGIAGGVLLVVGILLFARRNESLLAWSQGARHGQVRPVVFLILFALLGTGVAMIVSEKMSTIITFYWNSLLGEGGEGLRSRAEINLGFRAIDMDTWLLGNGTGSASMGIQYVLQDHSASVEGGYTSMVWELGVLGLVFYLALAFQLSRIYLKAVPRGRGHMLDAAVATFGPLLILELWYLNILGSMLQQYVVSIFLWFFSGLTWGLQSAQARLDRLDA